jgi:hypothetical protein
MNTLLQGVAAVIVGRGYLSSDHFSTATGLDPAITISKAGGNFANPAAGASVMTEIEATGWYKFSLGTGDTDTLGALIIRGTHATMDNIEVVYQVVAAVTAANLTQVNGAAQTATLDTIKAETALIVADTGELQTNQGNWLTATGFATSTELAKVPKSDSNVTWNNTALASINAEVDTALNTAIPAGPTANSMNERIAAIDDLTQASGSGDLAAVLADTNDLQLNQGNWLTATGFATPTNITAGTIGLTAGAVDDIFDDVVEGTFTLRKMLRVFMAVLAGKSSGGGTVTLKFQDVADTKPRITATVDSNGNRTAMTIDGD